MTLGSGTRVLMTTDAVGGVWTFAVGLSLALAARGVQSLLLTMGPRPTSAQRAMLAGSNGVSLMETDLELEWRDPAGADIARADDLLHRIAQGFRPHLIHFNSYREAAFGWSVPTIVVAHSCVNSWAKACAEEASFVSPAWSAYAANVADGLGCADAWVAPTASFRACIRQHYNAGTRGHVIWNGADGEPAIEAKLPVILAAGRVWDRAKNLAILSAVAPHDRWRIRIAGALRLNEGDVRAPIGGCEQLGALSHEDMLCEMQRASVFVSPSLYEPFGLSVLEAAQAGCALVLSDLPTFRELWDGAALFVEPTDAQGWQRALRSLDDDAELCMQMQRAARKRARRYTLAETAKKYSALYGAIFRRKNSATISRTYARASA